MAVALRSRPLDPASSESELERLLVEGRQFSGEFPQFLANHLPMVIVALHRLGASDARLAEFFEHYRVSNHLVTMPPPVAPIERLTWTAALGDRSRERDYRTFFTAEVARLGIRGATAAYLPTLVPAIAASATHAFMRLAYAVMRDDPAEAGAALGYWSAMHLSLGAPSGSAAVTDEPAAVLLRMKPIEAFRHVEVEMDLLWHFMRAMAAKPEFKPLIDWLAVGPDTLQRVASASLALYAGTMDFCALHALTGTHWLRLLWPVLPDPNLALRHFWQAIASLYPKIGFPDLPTPEMIETWRHAPAPDWPDIAAAAARSNDEHDLSLVFSAREEWKVYGDRLYQVVAARRVNLIP